MAQYRYRVNIIESERGWGQKEFDVKFFDDEQKANDFVDEFNKDLPAGCPDYYICAQRPIPVRVA